ncbi:MAG: zinc dependent phospholipase C family protein [Fluviicola sp.]|nr:zinc dependent phospholipase C family protein [Fluviicola sp.]
MANWFNFPKIKHSLLIGLLFLSFYSEAKPLPVTQHTLPALWGFFGHKRINRVAVFTLPPEMFGFFKEHIEYITEHAVDPDKRRYAVEGEAQRHYIDIDHYEKDSLDPFEIVPRKWYDAVEKFTEDTLQAYGIVPWHINVMKMRLQKAFESKNVDLILKNASDIGHYIGDAHVPLHTTENYNGQLSGQRGIHGLWESRIVELNSEDYDYFVGKGKYVASVLDFAWDAVEASNAAVDSVLSMEKELTAEFPTDQKYSYEQRGQTVIQVYSKAFCDEYSKRMAGMVERRMREAIIAVGSIWYTAWVDAGQPDLSTLTNTPPSAELLKELEELENLYEHSEHKGTICD